MLGKQVYEVTLIMRDTIKCGKDLLSLGLLIPEIELNQLPWKDSIATVLKRGKVTQDQIHTEKNLPPLYCIIHEDPTLKE